MDRRQAVKSGLIGGAVLWSAPVILATPAAAAGSGACDPETTQLMTAFTVNPPNTSCTAFGQASVTLCLSDPEQRVLLSRTAAAPETGAGAPGAAPIPDDSAVLTVTRPDATAVSAWIIRYQRDCWMAAGSPTPAFLSPAVNTGFPGPVDITELFGGQTGEFTVSINFRNSNAGGGSSDLFLVPRLP